MKCRRPSSSSHAGKSYTLYGPKELSQDQIVGLLTQVLKRKITYVAMEIEEFAQVLKKQGYTPYAIQHLSAVAQNCRDGVCSGTNDMVERLTGKKPLEMLEYIIKNQTLFS